MTASPRDRNHRDGDDRENGPLPEPPRWARRWLELCLPRDPVGRCILGDLLQEYARIARRSGTGKADAWFRRQAVDVGVRYLLQRLATVFPRVFGGGTLRDLGMDLRLAIRSLGRNGMSSAVIILTLALGIGANAAIFSVVDGVLLRPLAYPDAHELVRIWSSSQQHGDRSVDVSYRDFTLFRREARSFSDMAAFSLAPRTLNDGNGEPGRVTLARVSEGFFRVLGLAPAPGRDFLADEERTSAPVVLVSHSLWQNRYGGDPAIVGTTINIQDEPHEIVGVAPPGTAYPRDADVWRPLTEDEKEDDDRELVVLARLADGATMAAATQDVKLLAASLQDEAPDSHRGISAWVQPMKDMMVRDVRAPLLALLGAVAFLLLIACVNVTNVLLARAADREREMAIRVALGADRARLLRQLLTESSVLAAAGGIVGLLLGYALLQALLTVSPADTPRLDSVTLDDRVVVVMALVVATAGLVSGLIPGFRAAGADPQPALRGTRGAGGRNEESRLRSALVVVEVALSTVLVVGAGFLTTTFVRLMDFDRGLEPRGLLAVYVNPSVRGEERARMLPAFFDELEERVQALPGIRSVAFSTHPPESLRGFRLDVEPADAPGVSGAESPKAHLRVVTSKYFSTLGTPLLAGRPPTVASGVVENSIAVVNETFVRENLGLAPSGAVGTRIRIPALEQSVEIVAVAADVTFDATEPTPPMLFVFDPALVFAGMVLLARTEGEPPATIGSLRRAVWAMDPTMPLDDLRFLEQTVAAGVATPRFNMTLVLVFAGLALTLASVGIYGVMAHSVARRSREIGLRQALGANRGTVARMVLGRGLLLTGLGALLGILGAAGVYRLIASLLYGVSPVEPVVHATVALLLGAVALVASWIPARRATRVDPMTALRNE